MTKIAIIILNWNKEQDTAECLNSLKQIDYPDHEIILVDNGSTDGSGDRLKQSFPFVHLIKNQENLGFAQGNNVGIRAAINQDAAMVLLLNNDTVVEPDFLSKLVNSVETDKKIGIAAPKIMFYHEPERIWSVGGKYLSIVRKPDQAFFHEIDRGQQLKGNDLKWVSGCCMLIKREVFENIGYLDSDYWASLEDVDFCWRASKAGYMILIEPNSKIYHKFAVSFGGKHSPLYTYFRVRNLFIFLRKTKQWLPLMINLIIFPIYSIFESLRRGQWRSIKTTFIAIKDFFVGKYGVGPTREFGK